MLNLIEHKRVVWDVQSYLELWKLEPSYKLTMKFFSTLFKFSRFTHSLNFTLAFHSSFLPEEIIKISRSANFRIVITEDYSDFSSLLDAKTILISKDKHFYQFLKRFSSARILNIVNETEMIYYTDSFLDLKYGYFYFKDYNLWSAAMPSKRLNFPGVRKSGPSHAYKFNRGIFKSNDTHRFFQRPTVFDPIRKKTNIIFQESLNIPEQNFNIHKLEKRLSKKYFRLLPSISRVKEAINRSQGILKSYEQKKIK